MTVKAFATPQLPTASDRGQFPPPITLPSQQRTSNTMNETDYAHTERYFLKYMPSPNGDWLVWDTSDSVWIARCHSKEDGEKIVRLLNADR